MLHQWLRASTFFVGRGESEMKRFSGLIAGGVACLCAGLSTAQAVDQTLGTQNFTDGQLVPGVAAYEAASTADAAPFKLFNGSDLGPPVFNTSWTFSYAPFSVTGGALVLGIFDHDSKAA